MAKKGGKQAQSSGKLELIQAKGGNRACAHGSIYCRRCFGFTTSAHDKSKK